MAGTSKSDVDPWVVGWTAGAGVVVVAAGLLVTITALARRVATQAEDVRDAIDATRRHAEPLLGLPTLNARITAVAEALRDAGTGSSR